MAVVRIACATASQLLQGSLQYKTSLNSSNQVVPMVVTSITRRLSTIKVTNNLLLLTGDKGSVKVVNLKLTEPQNRPLVVLLSWLMAKPKHVHKFANYYIDKGFDVLNVNTSPWQLLWPVRGSQIIADEILKFVSVNKSYEQIVVHGFSVGAYQWSEVLVKIESNPEHYNNIIKRINGHIWDSAVDYEELDKGVPVVMFPGNVPLQNAFKRYMNFHLKTFMRIATQHYIKASRLFHSDLIKTPALFLLSKSDPVGGGLTSNLGVKEMWEKAGIEVHWKCWDNSPHVGHYYLHPKEYVEQLDTFLKRIGFQNESQ